MTVSARLLRRLAWALVLCAKGAARGLNSLADSLDTDAALRGINRVQGVMRARREAAIAAERGAGLPSVALYVPGKVSAIRRREALRKAVTK